MSAGEVWLLHWCGWLLLCVGWLLDCWWLLVVSAGEVWLLDCG